MKRHYGSLLGAALFVVFLVGCGGGGDDAPPPPANAELSGVASKGLIKGGTVSVYKINEDGQKVEYPILGTAVTDDNGEYSITIDYTGPVLVEIAGGHYKDEATGLKTDLARPLRAAIGDARGEVKVAITPLTELAVRRAAPGGFTPGKINDSNELLSQLVGCDIIATLPADPSNPAAFNRAGNLSQDYALFLAVLSQMAMNDYSNDIMGIIGDIEKDLNNGRLESTGSALMLALISYIFENENNITGIDNLENTPLTNLIEGIIENGPSPTGNLAEAEIALAAFLNNPTDENYNAFMNYINSSVPESEAAHLFIALATLMDIYTNDAISFIKDDAGLTIDALFADPDFDPNAAVIRLLKSTGYDQNIKDLFAEISHRLDKEVDAELEQAYGVNACIFITEFDTVYFDDTDVNILRTFAKFLKAICAYIQAVNLDVENWEVTASEGSSDIRELEDITQEQRDEFIANNKNLLTYSDTDKLDEFRSAFKSAIDQFESVVLVLRNLGEDGTRLRFKNAFSVDTEYELQKLIILEKHTLPSVLAAFEDENQDIITAGEEVVGTKIYVPNDTYAYYQTDYELYLEHMARGNDQVTLYDLINEDESLREVWEDYNRADKFGVSYAPYWKDEDQREPYRPNVVVSHIRWDDPIDIFIVPEVDITINGKENDWGPVPDLPYPGDIKVKFAHDSEDKFYVYVSFKDTAEAHIDHEWELISRMPGDTTEEYSLSIEYKDGQIMSDNEWKLIEDPIGSVIGYEIEFSDFARLTRNGNINLFELSSETGILKKELKLL
jgi:hypothetical protein